MRYAASAASAASAAWEDELHVKVEQLRGLLRPLDPFLGNVHPDDEMEINLVLRAAVSYGCVRLSGVRRERFGSARRVAELNCDPTHSPLGPQAALLQLAVGQGWVTSSVN